MFTNNAEEDIECFVFGISATDAVIGLSVDPAEATVCIMKRDGERAVHQLYEKNLPIYYYLLNAVIPVAIGVRQPFYSVNENSGSVSICIDVLSGRTAGRMITFYVRTVAGTAIGKCQLTVEVLT